MMNMRYFVLLIVMMFLPLSMYGQTGTQPAGNGVAGDPYLIGTAEELLWYALRVNDGYGTIEGKLINDIDYSMYNNQDRYMIGNQKGTRSFNGVFDGDGYTITIGFNFQKAALDCVGLFAFVDNATIKNLNVDGTLTISGQWWHVGSIVGGDSDVDGKTRSILNCTSKVVITATKEQDSKNFVTLGGIIGCSQKGTLYMEQCGFLGNIISVSKANAGKCNIEIGGLVGIASNGHIYESYVYIDDSKEMSLSDVGSTKEYDFFPICGSRVNKTTLGYPTEWHSQKVVGKSETENNNLRNCFFHGKVNGSRPTKNSKSPFKLWHKNINNDPDNQPTLDQILAVIDSKASDMYIYSTADMQRFANAVNGGNYRLNATLRKCIDYSEVGSVPSVGTNMTNKRYSGVFDGANHTINISKSLASDESYALFKATDGATIKNLVITGDISGGMYIGGLISVNNISPSTVSNCISYLNVNTSTSAYVGGFLFRPDADIIFNNCAFVGTINDGIHCAGYVANHNNKNIYINNSYTTYSGTYKFAVKGVISDNSYSVSSSDTNLSSGELCYNLNKDTSDPSGPWYQNIGTEPNPVHAKCSCPEHAGENKVVYKNDHKECPGATTTHHSTYNNIILTGAELFDYPDHKDVDFAAGDFECSICGQISIDSEGNYLIYNDDKLKAFAGEIEAGNMYNAKVLCNFDAGATTTVGTKTYPYSGTFDGGYNTITLYGTPLFDYVSSATIKNLLVAGEVKTEKGKNNAVGSIVADNINAPLTLESCISTVLIKNTGNGKGGNPTAGGLIGNAKVAGWSVSNCGFAGSFENDMNKVSGIVGNPTATGYIRKSIVYYTTNNYTANSANYNTFATSSYAKLTDCYYNRTLGTATRSGETEKEAKYFRDGTVRDLLNGVNNKTVWYHYGTNPGYDYPTIVGYVWTGATDSDWSNDSNWKMGIAPVNMDMTAADETITIPAVAFIKNHYPTISSNVKINNLHINPSAVVNIPAQDITVNVNGTITNQGTFTVNYGDAFSSVNGAPNLVISGASPKGITVNRTVKQDMLYYMGSATAEGTINEGYNTGGDYLAYFNAPTLSFVVARSEARFPVPQYVGCTVGLRPYGSGDVSIKQIGTIHNSENIPVHCVEGWNWLSNPYPYTAKTWDSDMGCGLLPELSDNMRKTVWVRRNIGGDKYTYATYNAGLDIATTHGRVNEDNTVDPKYATEDAKYIAPFQDYCIYVNTTGDYSISGIPAGSKYSHLKSASLESLKSVIRLNVLTDGNDIMDDQAVLVLREDGILGVSDIDSHKYTSSSLNQIHIHKHNSNNKYAIALYPSATDMEGVEIPMTVTSAKGTKSVTIAADLSEYIDDYDVILIDHKDQTEINLSTDSYDLSASDLSLKRFSIVLRKSDVSETENTGSATSIDNTITNQRFIAYTTQSNIIVELGSAEEGSAISIIDLMGREVTKINNSSKFNIIPISQKGVYIVLMNDKSQKVIVK